MVCRKGTCRIARRGRFGGRPEGSDAHPPADRSVRAPSCRLAHEKTAPRARKPVRGEPIAPRGRGRHVDPMIFGSGAVRPLHRTLEHGRIDTGMAKDIAGSCGSAGINSGPGCASPPPGVPSQSPAAGPSPFNPARPNPRPKESRPADVCPARSASLHRGGSTVLCAQEWSSDGFVPEQVERIQEVGARAACARFPSGRAIFVRTNWQQRVAAKVGWAESARRTGRRD
jgi:hypothetical protein